MARISISYIWSAKLDKIDVLKFTSTIRWSTSTFQWSCRRFGDR